MYAWSRHAVDVLRMHAASSGGLVGGPAFPDSLFQDNFGYLVDSADLVDLEADLGGFAGQVICTLANIIF